MIEIKNDRVISWGGCSNNELKKLSQIQLGNHLDRYGRSNWIWADYPKGEPVYSPQRYTLEQTEQLRKEWVKAEIEKLYPQDLQLKILTENQLGETEAFKEMQADRKHIKAESRKIDF